MMRLAHVIFMGLALLFVNYYIATHMLIVGLRGNLDYSYSLALGVAVVGVNIFILSCLVQLARRPVDVFALLPMKLRGWKATLAWLHLALIGYADLVLFASGLATMENIQVVAEDPAGAFMFAHNACLLLAFTFGLSALAHGLQSKLVKWLNPEASEK